MLTEILKTLREHPFKTGLIFTLVYIICFGWQAAAHVALAEVFTFLFFLILTSGDDDDFWDGWNGKDPRFA